MFIAKISKGRTIGEFIRGVFFAPVMYVFIWMIVFGGIGIEREREAAGVGLCCSAATDTAAGQRFFKRYPIISTNTNALRPLMKANFQP